MSSGRYRYTPERIQESATAFIHYEARLFATFAGI